jgi:hypothetical protein
VIVIIHIRDRGGGLAPKLADEKSLRIDMGETLRIAIAWIPSFRGGPLDRQRDFVRPHHPNMKITIP